MKLITSYPVYHFGVFVPPGRFGVAIVKAEERWAGNEIR